MRPVDIAEEKAREQRLRRAAARQGLKLSKSRTRIERATDFGCYWLADANTSTLVTYEGGISLDQVGEYLRQDAG